MKILIATAKTPGSAEGFTTICNAIRGLAAEGGLAVKGGILWTNGPGCSNLALEITGGNTAAQEEFGMVLANALMPSKWCETTDFIPESDTCELF